MKNVLLSADNEISVFAVPNDVADHLEQYCMEFCGNWLHKSPDAAKYRRNMSNTTVVCYTEKDFIHYLNRYIFEEQAYLVAAFPNCYAKEELPEEYAGLPYFNF